MPIVIPPGFAYVRVFYQSANRPEILSNGYGADIVAPLTQTDVDNLSAALAVSYKPMLATGSQFIGLHVQEGQDGAPRVWDTIVGAGAGSRTVNNPTTPQVQFLLDKKSALGGRKHRGRAFLTDVKEEDVDHVGNVLAATLVTLNTLAANVKANFTAGAWAQMVLLHTDSTVPTPVTSFTADPKVSTLRHRYRR